MASHRESSSPSSSDEEEQFFDTHDDVAVSDCSKNCSGCPNCFLSSYGYDIWSATPESAVQRRQRFLNWMNSRLDQNQVPNDDAGDLNCAEIVSETNRLNDESGAVLRNSYLDEPLYSSRTSMSSCCSANEEAELFRQDDSLCRNINLASIGSTTSPEDHQQGNTHGASLLIQPFVQKENELVVHLMNMKKSFKPSWFKKLTVKARTIGRQGEANLKPSVFASEENARFHRVKVQASGKRVKALSCLYAGQELPAHEGSISTMKFSPDGQFLASAGEDGVVRVWKVAEVERPDNLLVSPDVSKDKVGNTKKLKKSSESASMIVPSRVFCIIEEPLHEFHGHTGEVLALSWSKNGFLLSSSVDNTVRLWQIGCNTCLSVFSHNNYVTCVDFNPVDDNHFISGSIDGKIRVWSVSSCRVVYWIDTREIVSAVCYYPSGKGGIVGSVDGNCYFYDIRDEQFQLDAQTCLPGKKKLPSKRITGFQFYPSDPTKVLVTSADSQVRVLRGVDIISKFKGPRVSGSQAIASFTSDGKHVVSACEDSMISVWDYVSPGKSSFKAKKMDSSESFFSHNASIAIPWSGLNKAVSKSISNPSMDSDKLASSNTVGNPQCSPDVLKSVPSLPPDCLSLSLGLLLDTLPKGSATWPEEKLPVSSPREGGCSPICRPNQFFKSSIQSTCSSDLWGLVIVTAGQDGKIRTFQNYGLPIRL